MSLDRWISSRTQFFELRRPLALEQGGTLPRVRIAYRTWGRPQSSAILICHALTGSADADDWWARLFGPGRVLDPHRSFIVCANVLGGCYGTTGPTSVRPGEDVPYGNTFPRITIRDMVHSQAKLLDQLGVETLDLVVGGSMGGMQVLEWAVLYPERVRTIAPIGVGPAQSAWAIGLSEAQRQAIHADAGFRGGAYARDAGPVAGLAAARSLAMLSYRSPHNFESRFARRADRTGTFDAQSYLRYQGEKLVDRFDANTYLTLIAAMDSHDVGRGRGSTPDVLAGIRQPALVMSIRSDGLYPPDEVAGLGRHMPSAELVELDAPHGHDSFLIEVDDINHHLVEFVGRHRLTTGSFSRVFV